MPAMFGIFASSAARGRVYVVAGSRRHVVHDNGKVDGLGDRLVVFKDLLLGNGGKIGADDGKHVNAEFLCLERQCDGRFRARAAGTSVDGNTTLNLVDHDADDFQLFFLAEDVELAVCAEAEHRIRAGRDLAVDLMADLLLIQTFILMAST